MTLTLEQESLIVNNLNLTHHLAKRYYHEYLDPEDLAGWGVVGLIKASRNFDGSLGYKFSTFAGVCINAEIIKSVRKPQLKSFSLNQTFDEKNNTELINLIPSSANVEHEVEIKLDLPAAIKRLNKRESFVIKHRFGLNGQSSLTQKELAEILDISQAHVGRIEKRALLKLRSYLEGGNKSGRGRY